MAGLIVLDASVLIAHLEEEDRHHLRARDALAEAGASELAASSMTLAEVLAGPAQHERLDDAEAALTALDVIEVPLPMGVARRLAALRAQTKLKLPDCCVLLAAEDAGADTVLTFDAQLAAAARAGGFATS